MTIENTTKTTAQRLLNLYRQAHSIDGGWVVLNPYFISEDSPKLEEELKKLPNGWKLAKHIENLKEGKTQMDSISPDLTPYGGLMTNDNVYKVVQNIELPKAEFDNLSDFLHGFKPDFKHLTDFKKAEFFESLGKDWTNQAKLIIQNSNDKDSETLLNKLNQLIDLDKTYSAWYQASELLTEPESEKTKATAQTLLTEFESRLPKFGKQGQELLEKIRNLISSKGKNNE